MKRKPVVSSPSYQSLVSEAGIGYDQSMADPYNLARFIDAQAPDYDAALREIRQGRKRTHWMWYVFPQIAGLGHSPMAQRYAIGTLDEARAFLDHPVLGERLRTCVEALQDLNAPTADSVFGPVDAVKLRSSLTLFHKAGGGALFAAALKRWFGSADSATLDILADQ